MESPSDTTTACIVPILNMSDTTISFPMEEIDEINELWQRNTDDKSQEITEDALNKHLEDLCSLGIIYPDNDDNPKQYSIKIPEQHENEPAQNLGSVGVPVPFSGESSFSNRDEDKVRHDVKLVVWNKDRKKWLKGSDNGRLTPPEDYTFFRIEVPTARDLRQKEQGAKKSRCPPDTISNSSKTIKKGRRITSLKHVDYKKFLQCYIHIQELKDFKVDALFNKPNPEPAALSAPTTRRRRVKAESKSSKKSNMSTVFGECPTGIADITDSDFTPITTTLGLVQEFDAQIMSIDPSNPEEAFTVDLGGIDDVANFEQVDLSDSFNVSSSPPRRNEFGSVEISFDETGKPRCTYTDLIERALSENGGLTVSEIYQWISDSYSYFKPDDDRWKNSVRHNLSINPYFKKGEKARSGAGHLWTISEESRLLRPALRKKDFEYEDLSMCIENETDRAVANILGQYHLQKNNMEGKTQPKSSDDESDTLCTPPLPQPQKPVELSNEEGDKLMEVSPVVIEYEQSTGFPGEEYTIDLSQFQFPDANGLSFDDLMPGGGSLIVIQTTDDQDANKENMHIEEQGDTVNTEYLMTDYSTIRHESHITETERVSGQLISEAMTHDFDMHKDKCDLSPISAETCEEGPVQYQLMSEESEAHIQIQQHESPSQNTQEYLTLDSIDHLALQEVIHGNNISESGINHYQMMNVADYESNKDIIGGFCTFSTEVTP